MGSFQTMGKHIHFFWNIHGAMMAEQNSPWITLPDFSHSAGSN